MFLSTCSLVFGLVLLGCIQPNDAYRLPNVSNNTDDNQNLKIVNGYITNHNSFPFVVELFTKVNDRGGYTMCGGSIVNSNWIITAAHCITDSWTDRPYRGDQITVYAGIDSVNNRDNEGQHIQGSASYTHPDYRSGSNYADLALIKLSQPIQFTDAVDSVCLDYSERIEPYYYIAGFGTTSVILKDGDREVQSGTPGNELKFARMRETRDAGFCSGMESVCVEALNDPNDSGCIGDSGSPLIASDIKKILGVYSLMAADTDPATGYTRFCHGHSQYTRLSRFRNFIEQHIDSSYCIVTDA